MSLQIDLWTITFATALVVLVAGIVFIADTLVRRDDIAGRVWSLAYLTGMLTVVSYLFWAADGSAWWAVAVGNFAFVANAGCMWVGNRAYNNRPGYVWLLVTVVSIAAGVAVVAAGPEGGDWAGVYVMFPAIAVFAGGGGIEALRGDLGANPNARALSFVLLLQSAYFAARTVVFAVAGPDSTLFQVWFGSATTSFVTIGLVIVAAITMSVLRADRTRLRGFRRALAVDEAVTTLPALERLAGDWLEPALRDGRSVAAIAVRFTGLAEVNTAFGRSAGEELTRAWTAAVRRAAPVYALIGEERPGSLIIIAPAESAQSARRDADAIVDGLIDEDIEIAGIRPTATVGLALAAPGEDAAALIDRARSAADAAASVGEPVHAAD